MVNSQENPLFFKLNFGFIPYKYYLANHIFKCYSTPEMRFLIFLARGVLGFWGFGVLGSRDVENPFFFGNKDSD